MSAPWIQPDWVVEPDRSNYGTYWHREMTDMHGRLHVFNVYEDDYGACAEHTRETLKSLWGPSRIEDRPAWESCFPTVYEARQACMRRFRQLLRRQERTAERNRRGKR